MISLQIMATPVKFIHRTPKKEISENCLLCDINFKSSGRTTTFIVNSRTNPKDSLAAQILRILKVDVNLPHLQKSRMCNTCKLALGRIDRSSSERQKILDVLKENVIPQSRFKRCTPETPSPRKNKMVKKCLSMDDVPRKLPLLLPTPASCSPKPEIKCFNCSERMHDDSIIQVHTEKFFMLTESLCIYLIC